MSEGYVTKQSQHTKTYYINKPADNPCGREGLNNLPEVREVFTGTRISYKIAEWPGEWKEGTSDSRILFPVAMQLISCYSYTKLAAEYT